MALFWLLQGDGRSAPAQSWFGQVAEPGWWCWQAMLLGDGEEVVCFIRHLAKARARSEPIILRKRAEQAWRMRWCCLLACAAARAFAAWFERPSWPELRRGRRPPESASKEPGEWQHGWQYWASSVSDKHFRKITMLSGQTAANRAHLRSHSGRNAGVVFAHAPTAPEYVIPPHLFRVLLQERLRLPLPITEGTCGGCGPRWILEESTEWRAPGLGGCENGLLLWSAC